MRTIAVLVAAAVTAVAGAGCDSESADEAPVAVGTLVASWSEAAHDPVLLEAIAGRNPADAVLITQDSELNELLAGLDPSLDDPPGTLERLAAVDLTEHVLVAGAYPRCADAGSVVSAGGRVWFQVTANDEDGPIACAWSPLEVEIWQVPLADVGGEVPGGLTPPTIEG